MSIMTFPLDGHRFTHITSTLALSALIGLSQTVTAGSYTLAIQPVLSAQRTIAVYTPLAQYLSAHTGHDIRIETSRDFYSYWTQMNRGEFDFLLDAAHFTGYRAKNMGYHVLAAMPDTLTYSLVSSSEHLVLGADELVGQPVATMGPPSLGALRLEALYSNPMREPHTRSVSTATDAIDMVRDGRAVAAMVPTPLAAEHNDLNIVLVTEPTPHLAVSASPKVPYDVRIAIQGALLGIKKDAEGGKILSDLRFVGFETTSAERYLPYAALIESSRVNLALPSGNKTKPVAATDLALVQPAE